MSNEVSYRIVAFDGVCNLCNSTVNWIIDNDPKQQFKFVALQNIERLEALGYDLKELGLAQNLSSAHSGSDKKTDVLQTNSSDQKSALRTVYLIEGQKLYQKSTAVLRICRGLSGLYPLLYLYILIPRPLRDIVYDLIAQNRYKWFGRQDHCRLPSPELKDRFL